VAYVPQAFEARWQELWRQQRLYVTTEDPSKPKFYCLDFFPYPSGEGLSVGHCRNYMPTDVISRYMRMQGFNVLHPMGWDAFGEPTENAAIQRHESPRALTDRFTTNYKRQMELVGISFDWTREIDSSQPEFYRWTQWFFLLLYRRGLAYRATHWQWWCPVCQTTMSESEVHERADELYCWRDHAGVTKRQIPAWFFRITAYADRLLADLTAIDWPEETKRMQENWIGRSEGAEIVFRSAQGHPLPVFTTRPDTVFGVTFMAMAPEHELVDVLTAPERREAVRAYAQQAQRESEITRLSTEREKTGVFTGAHVVNPLNGQRVPLFVADYVLATYGTGLVMGVPGHDQRDFAFARRHGLPARVVIAPPTWHGEPLDRAYVGPGPMVRSGRFDGTITPGDWPKLAAAERQAIAEQWGIPEAELDRLVAAATVNGIAAVTEYVEREGIGKRQVSYRMRDWLISRQRYWGTPIPIVDCEQCGEVPVPEDQLPIVLPEMDDIAPLGDGQSALARATRWLETTCPTCGGPAQRETDTLGGFACSAWYYLRFTSPDTQEAPFDPERMRFWMPVDLYVGGAEHAVMHLLYARFWYKVMHDAGLGVPSSEPFTKLRHQGQVLAADGQRMSKSRGNVITPDDMVAKYGADSLRVYELFMAPFEQTTQWSEEGLHGTWRFLRRVWELVLSAHAEADGRRFQDEDSELTRLLHQTIRRTTQDIERFRFNTMIAGLMAFVNTLSDRQRSGRAQSRTFQESVETLLRLLAPSAPHLAEELWHRTGREGSVHQQPWPQWDVELAHEPMRTIVVQVNGRVRDHFEIPADAPEAEVRTQALMRPKIRQQVPDPSIARVVYVPGRLVNIVVR
jgi:leucyl-tRNA synthetase